MWLRRSDRCQEGKSARVDFEMALVKLGPDDGVWVGRRAPVPNIRATYRTTTTTIIRHRSRQAIVALPHSRTSTMSSLDPPTYLGSIQNNIRARPISWEGAVRAKTITDEDLKKIKSIDKVRKEQRKQTIESDVESFVTLLVGGNGSQSIFEAAAKRQDIIHYMLVLLGDMIDGRNMLLHIGC